MARVYSWKLSESENIYAYIASPEFARGNSNANKTYVGNELISNDSCEVANWAQDCSFQEYEEHFNELKRQCGEDTFENDAMYYYEILEKCNLKGPKGDRGSDGAQGPRGYKGEPGDIGPVGPKAIPSKTFFVFITSETNPGKPVGGEWNPYTGNFEYPTLASDKNKKWSNSDNIPKPIWMSNKTFNEDSKLDGEWSSPTMISGEDGEPGADGTNKEFIFARTANYQPDGKGPDTSKLPKFTGSNHSELEKYGWFDSPQGVDDVNYRVEWVSTTKKDENGNWGDWTPSAVWAKFGSNGQDGDGVQYIYFLTEKAIPPKNPTPKTENGEYDLDTDAYQEIEQYDGIEYLPPKPNGFHDGDIWWTDNATGVDTTYQHEWVCTRKRRKNPKDEKGNIIEKYKGRTMWGPYYGPTLWSKYGDNGNDGTGYSSLTLYLKQNVGTPTFDPLAKPNDQGNWARHWPEYEIGKDKIWSITASVVTGRNELAPGSKWEGPCLMTVVNAKVPDYNVDVYALSDSKPYKPSSKLPQSPGESLNEKGETVTWKDYPDITGNWWKCVGVVDGTTNMIKEENGSLLWGAVNPHNGRDGVAKDGKYTEFRCKPGTPNQKPELDANVREPLGWYKTDENITELAPGETIWEIWAEINSDDSLVIQENEKGWQGPRDIKGERGEKGETGPTGEKGETGAHGVTGVPGVSMDVRYCEGTKEKPRVEPDLTAQEQEGWESKPTEMTEEYRFMWFIQGKRKYKDDNDEVGHVEWEGPFRIQGLDGENGKDGKSQAIYPAGMYSYDKKYVCTETKAPYVYDSNFKAFYVMNYIGEWIGNDPSIPYAFEQTPGESYIANPNKYWTRMESFEALFAKVAVIANGTVGSLVFNEEFIFSQQGLKPQNTPEGEIEYVKCDYTDYHPNADNRDLYADITDGLFIPNLFMNALTGESWFAGKEFWISSDGTIHWGRIDNIDKTIKSHSSRLDSAETNISYATLDGWISSKEKYKLKDEWDIIQSEYAKYSATAKLYGILYDDYKTAYVNLNNYYTTGNGKDLFKEMGSKTQIEGKELRNFINAYYEQRDNILDSLSSDSLSKLDDISNDNKITPDEKQRTLKEWEAIKLEHPNFYNTAMLYHLNATVEKTLFIQDTEDKRPSYDDSRWSESAGLPVKEGKVLWCKQGISSGADSYRYRTPIIIRKTDVTADKLGKTTLLDLYNSSYSNLKKYLVGTDGKGGILKSLDTTDTIVGTTFRENFKMYYECRNNITEAISFETDNSIKEAGNTDNIDYITNLLRKEGDTSTEISQGVVLSNFIGVRAPGNNDIKSFFNGANTYKDASTDSTLVLAAGIPSNSSNLENRCNEANSRIYENGDTYLAKENAIFKNNGEVSLGKTESGNVAFHIDTKGIATLDSALIGEISTNRLNTVPNRESESERFNQIVIEGNEITAYSNKDNSNESYETLRVTGGNSTITTENSGSINASFLRKEVDCLKNQSFEFPNISSSGDTIITAAKNSVLKVKDTVINGSVSLGVGGLNPPVYFSPKNEQEGYINYSIDCTISIKENYSYTEIKKINLYNTKYKLADSMYDGIGSQTSNISISVIVPFIELGLSYKFPQNGTYKIVLVQHLSGGGITLTSNNASSAKASISIPLNFNYLFDYKKTEISKDGFKCISNSDNFIEFDGKMFRVLLDGAGFKIENGQVSYKNKDDIWKNLT